MLKWKVGKEILLLDARSKHKVLLSLFDASEGRVDSELVNLHRVQRVFGLFLCILSQILLLDFLSG